MFNWKKRIDEALRRESSSKTTNTGSSLSEYWQEQKKNLKELGGKFKCHVCKRPSKKPNKTWESRMATGENESTGTYWDDWSRPGDLFECSRCHNWTCPEHLHLGICKKCAWAL